MTQNPSSDFEAHAETVRARLAEADEMLHAIRHGEIDALVVEGPRGTQVYTLQSADEPYRNLVEQMQEGAVVVSADGHILYSNARFAAMVGEPLESVVASRFDRFVKAADRVEFDALLTSGAGRVRSRLVGQASGVFEVSLSLITTRSSAGDRLNVIVTDLTELLDATSNRVRAERDSRSKDEFLAILAHELRNPLSAITNSAGVLVLTHGEGERASAAHDVIRRQVIHISHLIDGLLDVERVVSGKIRLNRSVLDLAESVRRAVGSFTDDPKLDRHIAVSAEPVWINGDAERLHQVLINVVTNAVKYTPAGGRIAVAVWAEGRDAVVSVEDTGLGISARLLPFIFDLYVQADRTLDRARGGLGIGLALVRSLVELHGGTIVASSAGEGRGSKFTIRLARVLSTARTAGVPLPKDDRRSRPRRVLLIEDNTDAREMLRMMLELAGHDVYGAPDGPRGLEILTAVRPDVVIVDIGLPRMDGYQVAKRIREDPHGRNALLVALTGYSSAEDIDRALEHGFDHHLVKPIDTDRLTQLLDAQAGA